MKQYGLILDKIAPQDHVLGSLRSLEREVIREDGQWVNFLPKEELQAAETESMACVSFGTLNACEVLLKAKGIKDNFSDRWLAWNSGTTKQGNSPQTVAETLRKAGVPKEEGWEITTSIKTWEDFYENPPPKLFELAREHFLNPYVFGHEWVPTDHSSLKEGLKYSPIGVAVFAWIQNGDYYVRPEGAEPNHWCLLIGYKENDHWLVFDSYDSTLKKLSWTYVFGMAKRYQIKKKDQAKDQAVENYKKSGSNWLTQIINNFLICFKHD